MKSTFTICGVCGNNTCGLEVIHDAKHIVEVKGDREHPFSQGRICPMARAVPQIMAAPNLLTHPLRRKGNGWTKITWETALDEIVTRLQEIRLRHGAQSVAVYQGHAMMQMLRQGWVQRFINLFGTPNLVQNDHLCNAPTAVMERMTYGRTSLYGFDPEKAGMLVLWGLNPATSASTTFWPQVMKAHRKGKPLVVIDPRRTKAARFADLHLAPLPGTDAALALGLINLIIQEQRHARNFVDHWATGFNSLSQAVKHLTPERVAAITGVKPTDLHLLADMFSKFPPVNIRGGNALEHHSNSSQILRAICIIRSLLGSLDVPGGHQFSDPFQLANMTLADHRFPCLPILGTEKYPLFISAESFVPGDVFVETLLTGRPYPIRAALLGGGNPLLTWPNSNRLSQALDRLEFTVAMDIRQTETCRKADIVLPMASFLERRQLIAQQDVIAQDSPSQYLGLQRLVLDPGQRRSDWWLWKELACRLGYADAYPWPNIQAAIDTQLEPLGLSFKALEEAPHGHLIDAPHQFRSYQNQGFNTPSGKVELWSHTLAAHGHDPLPRWIEPKEAPDPDTFPLILNAGRRSIYYAHSQFRDVAQLSRRNPFNQAEINPRTASDCKLVDGDDAIVETRRGSIKAQVKVTDTIISGVVNLLHGWHPSNVNLLTDDGNGDPILASAPLRSGACRLFRAEGNSGPRRKT